MQDFLRTELRTEPHHIRLLAKLEASAPLSQQDRAALYALPIRTRLLRPEEDLVLQGDEPHESCLVLEGLVSRYKLLEDGRRQILAIHVAGDIPDLHSLHLRRMDHSLAALSRARVAFIPHENLRQLMRRCPEISDILWRETLVDGAIFREWMVGMGRRSAYGRLAHLLCEVAVKMDNACITRGGRYPLPLTQTHMADALGLSAVHVNRVLKQLRTIGAIQIRAGEMRILDWDRLAEAGEFTPDYLHIRRPAQTPSGQVAQTPRAAVASRGRSR